MEDVLYLGLDAHTRICVLSAMNSRGMVLFTRSFKTSERALRAHVTRVSARTSYLALEESTISGWIAGVVRPHVDRLIVCDPKHNALISQGNKDDFSDAVNLCQLLRLDALVAVYHSDQDDRVDFKIAVQQYLHFRNAHASLKTKIKFKFQQAGIIPTGDRVFSQTERSAYLAQLPTESRRKILINLYAQLDALGRQRQTAQDLMEELGRSYLEIIQFQQMPGIGMVGAHLFSGLIQTPHRFRTRQQLWRYCRLGIVARSSAGKPLSYKRLDRSGSGVLKAVSHQCWKAALRTKSPNEVRLYYEASLKRTGNRTHARLNTRRKALALLWTIWKNDVAYNAALFYESPAHAVDAQALGKR